MYTSFAGCGSDFSVKYQPGVNNVDIDNNSNTTSASYNISFSCWNVAGWTHKDSFLRAGILTHSRDNYICPCRNSLKTR